MLQGTRVAIFQYSLSSLFSISDMKLLTSLSLFKIASQYLVSKCIHGKCHNLKNTHSFHVYNLYWGQVSR